MSEQQSGYLTVGHEQIYGTYYSSVKPAEWCLTLAEPFGEEKKCASRMLVRMAKYLSEQHACAVFKFDFSGTGDSSGKHSAATIEQWQEELQAAISFIQKTSSAPKTALLGLRAGALIAVQAASTQSVDQLILASPLLSGAELLKELQRRQKIKTLLAGNQTPDASSSNDFGGVVLNGILQKELEGLSLLSFLAKLPDSRIAHLIHTTGAKSFPPAWNPLLTLLKKNPQSQQILLHDKPFWGQLEYYESNLIQETMQKILYA